MDLQQFGLKPLKITDRPIIDSILKSQETMLSAYTFATHYIWHNIFKFYWGIMDNYLCIFAKYNGYIYMPIPPVPCNVSPESAISFQKILTTVFYIMDRINKNKTVSRIENIDENQIKDFISLGYAIRPGEPEYLYLCEDLTNLRGDRYKSKRAVCNYFIKHYFYSYESFQPSLSGNCIKLYSAWKMKRARKINDPFYHALLEHSFSAHRQALRHYKSLQLTGRVVRIDDRVEGYIFGFERGNIFYILMEIANPKIKGLAQFIFREFCREMDGYTYINTLADSGLENLRRVKLSYRPYKITPLYIACEP